MKGGCKEKEKIDKSNIDEVLDFDQAKNISIEMNRCWKQKGSRNWVNKQMDEQKAYEKMDKQKAYKWR